MREGGEGGGEAISARDELEFQLKRPSLKMKLKRSSLKIKYNYKTSATPKIEKKKIKKNKAIPLLEI